MDGPLTLSVPGSTLTPALFPESRTLELPVVELLDEMKQWNSSFRDCLLLTLGR